MLSDKRCTLLQGNSARLGDMLGANSVDVIVTDPPAGISFMNRGWDSDRGGRDQWIAWLAELLKPAFKALKPGGHALLWALPRTSHWTAMALELAGFEIRDVHHHLFGSGFPKSLNVSKAIDKLDAGDERRRRALAFTSWMRTTGLTAARIDAATNTSMGGHYLTDQEQPAIATAAVFALLRPLLPPVPAEIEDLVRERTVESQNTKCRRVVGHVRVADATKVRPGFNGSVFSGENAGATREVPITRSHTREAATWEGFGTALKPAVEHWILARKPMEGSTAANVLAHGTGALNIDRCLVGSTAMHGTSKPGTPGVFGKATGRVNASVAPGRWPAHLSLEHAPGCAAVCTIGCPVATLDAQSGGGSRFFYVPKASRKEKDAGLTVPRRSYGAACPRGGAGRAGGARNHHPTVKSVLLMRWLIRLVTPPGGVVLDVFAGSGTTGLAALAEGCSFVGVEQERDYIQLARGRLTHALRAPR